MSGYAGARSLQDLRVEFRTTKLEGSAADKKESVEGYLIRICDVLAIEGRNPDKWEANQVLATIGALQAGFYRLAAATTDLVMAPPEERAAQWRDPNSGITRQQLEHAVHIERKRPPREEMQTG